MTTGSHAPPTPGRPKFKPPEPEEPPRGLDDDERERFHQLSPEEEPDSRGPSEFELLQPNDGISILENDQLSPAAEPSMKSAKDMDSPDSLVMPSQKLLPSGSLRSSVPSTRSKRARLTAGVSSSGPTL